MLISHSYNTVRETFVFLRNVSNAYLKYMSLQCGIDLTETLSHNSNTI